VRTWLRFLTALCFALVIAVRPGTGAASREPGPQQPVAALGEPATLEDLLESAESLLRQGKGFAAQPLFERARDQAIALGRETEEAQARTAIGEILFYRTQYMAAREQGLTALETYQRLALDRGIGRASLMLSTAEELLGNRESARTHAERAIGAYDRAGYPRGRALATLQMVRVARLSIPEERPLFQRAISDARAAGDPEIEGNALHSLGDHLFSEGFFEEALDTLTRAKAVFETTTALDELGTVYNSLGRVYRAHGRLDEALKSQLTALELHEKANSPFELMQSLNAVATVYQRMGDLRKARSYYERSLALAEKSSSPRVQDFLRANLANLLIDQGQFSQGASALEQVIAHGLDAYLSRRYATLSLAYSKMARPQDALAAASKAVDGCAKDDEACVSALGRRAAAYQALGNPHAALSDINAALSQIEDVRTRLVPSDFFKQDFHHAQEGMYSFAIGLQLHEKQDRLALETAELARSRAFLDLLASRDVRFKDKDRAEIAALRENGVRQALPVTLESTPPQALAALTFRGAGTVATGPAVTSPSSLELNSLVTAAPSATADLIATAARLQSTIVAYWVGDDELFIWVITPEGAVNSRRVGVLRSKLLELIRATSPFTSTSSTVPATRAIATRGSDTVALQSARPGAWRELHTVLIDPIRAYLPRATGSMLTIVPQGPLLNVSFAALQNARGRYLLEDYTLHYAPAGAVLQFTAPKRRADARTGSMLVVADPTLPRLSTLDRPLARLPGARSEAASIAKLIPASRLTVLQDVKATEALARESVAGKAVLHFATHAIVSDEDPFRSFLALGPSTGATGADGLLTSEEVYGLDLNADLVVLSACRSAGGSVTGDGISAFARAFIYAGTATLVASLWDVADEPTNRLLPDFYKSWLAGESKGRALRSAQLRLLRDLRAGRVQVQTPVGAVSLPEHPVFWAGFALFGEPD
jgi:CHAT domain-containing protein/tetratricopeptide (TPR) repeat protein